MSIECRSSIWPGYNEAGQARESLPLGEYIVSAEEYPAENNACYGTVYMATGDPRGRDIHGGGSDLPDPFADEQGFEATFGCLRVLNKPGDEIAKRVVAAGNAVALTVQEESYA